MQNDKVGSIIRKARLAHNMTQKQLADKMDISDKAISKWECGAGKPDICLILELSNVLGIDVRELLKVYEKS
ncbi:anaerobic benzoate catabolism transcriptional regulator [Anaerotignum neopropionicum]|uniref:Anaerobic benzoate catabolism transcriptional regulator n=1 Tax=Anaerotignum neopropionicum TaxID=36847 RepID=A0A136WGL8_9FIRM|nr:helix-turn-helix transcriptional regulator [Anaerotignum neopropionicum]KXL53543.1 anaerobic benzoate catabolism transcriptional regulator [Anaerotignum neopropionicum]